MSQHDDRDEIDAQAVEAEATEAESAPEAPSAPSAPSAPNEPEVRTVEQWSDELSTPAWLFAGARMLHAWPVGRELTEAQYQADIDAAANVTCR